MQAVDRSASVERTSRPPPRVWTTGCEPVGSVEVVQLRVCRGLYACVALSVDRLDSASTRDILLFSQDRRKTRTSTNRPSPLFFFQLLFSCYCRLIWLDTHPSPVFLTRTIPLHMTIAFPLRSTGRCRRCRQPAFPTCASYAKGDETREKYTENRETYQIAPRNQLPASRELQIACVCERR